MGATILVLEDDLVLRDLLAEVLTDEGHNVIAATSLPHLLDLLPTRPHLLITDLLIALDPVGIKAIEQVRTATRPNLPAILCTGAAKQVAHLQPEIDRLRAQVLAKPFTIDELIQQVDQALGQTHVISLPVLQPVCA